MLSWWRGGVRGGRGRGLELGRRRIGGRVRGGSVAVAGSRVPGSGDRGERGLGTQLDLGLRLGGRPLRGGLGLVRRRKRIRLSGEDHV